jgi:hypothetical protein
VRTVDSSRAPQIVPQGRRIRYHERQRSQADNLPNPDMYLPDSHRRDAPSQPYGRPRTDVSRVMEARADKVVEPDQQRNQGKQRK